MTDSIVIAGEMGNKIVIEVYGYENPTALNDSDANWLSCAVVLSIGVFSGSIPASFTTEEFVRFFEEIGTALSKFDGVASFLTEEEILQLSIKFYNTGRVQVSGVAHDLRHDARVTFSFSFESDQSFLTQTCRQLEKIIRKFPIKQI